MKQYGIGMDFGSLSARAVLVRLCDGTPMPKSCVYEYPHGVITSLCGTPLPKSYALQDPSDYLSALEFCLSRVVEQNGVDSSEVASIGIDFTDATILPVDKFGIPLCQDPKFERNPHAWVKLWKHHGGEQYVEEMEEVARKVGDDLLSYSGGKISCELTYPKILETLRQAPEVYEATDLFMHAGDFVARNLTGCFCHSSTYASLKEHRKPNGLYPSPAYFAALDPRMEHLIGTKISEEITELCKPVGTLTPAWSARTGLPSDVVVATPVVDAHAPYPIAGIEDGLLLLALGTSACACLLTDMGAPIYGVMSQGFNIAVPNKNSYDAGISAMGDLFAWFVTNCVPSSYERAAAEAGMNIHGYLCALAQKQSPGQHGLLALDWWNGSRSVLCDNRLSGLLLGMSLSTKPEDIYRALMETCAYALRRVIEMYEAGGAKVKKIMATGGISKKNPLMMQICADVFGKEIRVLASDEPTALGSAAYGAVACGYYASLEEASAHMKGAVSATYKPTAEGAAAYEELYREYLRLCDYFGQGENPIMKKLYRGHL